MTKSYVAAAAITVSLGNQWESLPLPSWQQVGQSQEEGEEKCTVPGVSQRSTEGRSPHSSLGLHVPPPIIPQGWWCREVDPSLFCTCPCSSQHLFPSPSLFPCLWLPLTPQSHEG